MSAAAMVPPRLRGAVAVVGALALAACGAGYSAPDPVTLPAAVTAPTTPAPQFSDCEVPERLPAVASYPPLDPLPAPGQMPPGSYMAEIAARGRLIVGTSIDTLLFAAVDPDDGAIKGFDVDIAGLVAAAIFGEPADPNVPDPRVELRGITYAQRIPAVVSGEVDLVAHTMTVNCQRWQVVAFSSVYLNAGQKLLVAKGSGVTDVNDLAGLTVCVSAGGTSADKMRAMSVQPPVEVLEVSNQTDCLVAFQRGEADVIRSDDTVLGGFAQQDPSTEVVGEFLTEEPYGMAMSQDHPEFVRFVNAVLDRARADGTWQALYDKSLAVLPGEPLAGFNPPVAGIPQPDHSRPLP